MTNKELLIILYQSCASIYLFRTLAAQQVAEKGKGMYFVWYDDSSNKPLSQKLDEISARYCQRYGHAPTRCLLSEKSSAETVEVEGLTFETATNVLLNYLWLQV